MSKLKYCKAAKFRHGLRVWLKQEVEGSQGLGEGEELSLLLTMTSWVVSSSQPASQVQSTDNALPFSTVSSGLQERGVYSEEPGNSKKDYE